MKSTIVYLHGYGSSPESPTAHEIKKHFPNENFHAPHINHEAHPSVTKKQMDDLASKLHKHHDPIVIGSSAGGFWADHLAAHHGFKTVLVNPSLNPSENFKKYNQPKEHYSEYQKLEKGSESLPRHHTVVFHGENDDVVPLHQIKKIYKNPTILSGEGHRLNDLSPVINAAKKMVGNFPEHDN